MKVLIFGVGGMLGHKLYQKLSDRFEVCGTIRQDFDFYQKYDLFEKDKIFDNVAVEEVETLKKIFDEFKPDAVVNAVGIIKQLPSSKNVVETLRINSIFPHQLAELCDQFAARLITISTDCVFSGKDGNYTEESLPDALDLYGCSKKFGEVEGGHLTLRTSIIGRELDTAHGLVEWFLSNHGESVKGYSNAIFSGFPTVVLAEIIGDVIENQRNLNGLYHISSAPIDKFHLLELVKFYYQADIQIEPFADFYIDRSLNSEKFRKATNFQPPDWGKMIEIMAADNFLYENK